MQLIGNSNGIQVLTRRHAPAAIESAESMEIGLYFCHFLGSPWLIEFRERYGYLSLLLQNLEQELATTMGYMKRAYEFRGLVELEDFEPDSKLNSFENLIDKFARQLNETDGCRDFIRHLHETRMYRNRLIHQLLKGELLEEISSAGGRKKLVMQLNKKIELVICLTTVIHAVGRDYGAECGVTSEIINQLHNQRLERLGLNEKGYAEFVLGEELPWSEKPPETFRLEDL